MDKQRLDSAIKLAESVVGMDCSEAEYNAKVMNLAGLILIAQAIEDLKPPPFPFGSLRAESRYAVGVDIGVKDDGMAEFTHDFDVITNEDLLKEAVKRGLITLGE